MIFSHNKHVLTYSNKKIRQKLKRFSDLPTLIFFGMLGETQVFFFFFFQAIIYWLVGRFLGFD